MRAPDLRFGPILLILLFLAAAAERAPAQQRFWIGGSGEWQDPFRWASTEGGLAGAGVPTSATDVEIIDDDTTLRTISFTADAFARDLIFDLANGQYDLDLGGFTLRVGTNVFLIAASGESNRLGIHGGELRTWNLESGGAPGDTEIVVGPDANVELFPAFVFFPGNLDAARLQSRGQGAEITVEGTVRLNDSLVDPAPPFVDITSGGLIRVNGGDLVNEGSMRVGSSFVGSDPSTSGSIQVGSNGFVDTTTDLLIGRDGVGSVTVVDGSNFVSRGPTILGGESTGDGNVTLGGVGNLAQWLLLDQITVADAGRSDFFVGLSGFLDASAPGATMFIGAQGGSEGELLVRDGGLFDSTNAVYVGGTATASGGIGDLIARNQATVSVADQIKVWSQGTLEADGGTVTADQIQTTSGSTLRVAGDGSIETTFLNLGNGTDLDLQRGELAVVGPGATFITGLQNIAFGSTAGEPTIRLQDVIANVTNWQLGISNGELARTVVTGGQGSLFASQALRVGGGIGSSNGTLEVLDGATASAGDDIVLADGLGSTGTAIVQGVSSGGSRSLLRKNFGVAPEELIVGRRGSGNLSVLDGGLVQSLSSMSLGSRADGDGTVTVSGSSGGIPSELSVSQDLAIAGSASNVGPGGTGLLRVESAGSVLVGDLTTLYGGGTVDVQFGARLTTDRLHLLDGTLQNDGIIDVGGTASSVADGELVVADGGELVVDGGSHRFGTLRLEPGSTFDFLDGSLNVAGGSLQFPTTSYVYGSTTGLPTIELSEGALGEVTFVWRVGRSVGTNGLTVVRDPGTRLANTGGGAGADLAIGYEGTGFMEIYDGGEVDFNDDVVIAEFAGARGSALVQGVVDGQRARLLARGGSNNDLIVGQAGDGDLTVADGGYVFAADDVAVGSVSGGTGLVTVTGAAGEVPVPAVLEANDDFAVGVDGATPPNDLGIATILIFEGGEVVIGDRTVVGPGDQISLLGGTLRTGRLDLGGDPNRLDWQSGTLDLTASGLVVNATGLLGTNVTLAADMTLRTDGPLQVFDQGVLTLAGGAAVTNDLFYVEDGSILQGEGTIQSDLGAAIEGRIYPGNSAGTLSVVGNLGMIHTTETTIEIGGLAAGSEHDQIVVDGNLILDGELIVSLIDGFVLDSEQTFQIADVAGTLSGTFFGLPDGALVGTFGGVDLLISYTGGDGNDVVLYTEGTSVVSAPNLPTSFQLRVAPNPFNPATTLAMDIPRRAAVEVDVFDVRGALVRRLLTDELEPGRHELHFDGTDRAGRQLASGVYFARVRFAGREHLQKMTLVK